MWGSGLQSWIPLPSLVSSALVEGLLTLQWVESVAPTVYLQHGEISAALLRKGSHGRVLFVSAPHVQEHAGQVVRVEEGLVCGSVCLLGRVSWVCANRDIPG